jgi:hypothetical protein
MLYSPSTGGLYACVESHPEDVIHLTLPLVAQLLGARDWKTSLEVSGSVPAEPFRVIVEDTQQTGGAFMLGSSFEMARVGGTGHREALTGRMTTDAAPPGEFAVAVNGVSMVRTGAGNAFGIGGYAQVNAEAAPEAEAVGAEFNTDVRRDVTRKVGLQVIDAATSTGTGTSHDAGVLVAAQPGGAGYSVGLKFGIANGFGVRPGGTLIYAQSTPVVLRAGLDLEALTGFSVAPILLRPNTKGIYWGSDKAGGAVVSETGSGGGDLVFGLGATSIRYGGLLAFQSTAQDTYVTVRTGSDGHQLFRRLVAGAPDSAGTGYRTLKVEN